LFIQQPNNSQRISYQHKTFSSGGKNKKFPLIKLPVPTVRHHIHPIYKRQNIPPVPDKRKLQNDSNAEILL
jgi:hypothetical protein